MKKFYVVLMYYIIWRDALLPLFKEKYKKNSSNGKGGGVGMVTKILLKMTVM